MFQSRVFRAVVLLLFGLLLIGGAWPYVFAKTEQISITDTVRAERFAGEDFVKLSDGYTHYIWSGPETGRVVVFVHGFSSPCFIWQKQADALAAAGYRVLRFDLYGRGHSDRPNVDFDAELYHRQLVELLDSQKVTGPIDIVGLSMGGPITLRFVDREPERVRSFGLIAPAGFGANLPAAVNLLRVPGLADWIIQAFGDRIILGSVETMASDNPAVIQEIHEQYVDQLQYAGYKRALLSTLRHHPMLGLGDLYERVGKSGKPGILFWGDADRVVPYENSEKVRAAIPGIEFHTIKHGSHTPNYEKPGEVNPALLAFLSKQS